MFSITARAPVIRQSIDSFHERLSTERESYAISVEFGYEQASVLIRGNIEYLIAWFRAGLARDVTWIAPHGQTVWQGFVNKLTLTTGASKRIQSLDNLANRIHYVYGDLDTSTTPPTSGEQKTITVNNTTSQGVYGVKAYTDSAGERTTVEATANADMILANRSKIWEDGTDSFGSGGDPSLRVGMLGYAHMLDWFNYSNAGGGTIARDALIKLIIAADPNSIISSDFTNVDSNSGTVEQYRDGDQAAWGLINDIGEAGAGGYRWVSGIYKDRKLFYKQSEGVDSNNDVLVTNKHSVITRSLHDSGERFFDRAGREIDVWDIRPDRLVKTIGLSSEPQYIEYVTYSAPVGLEIRSTDANPLRRAVLL